MDFSNNEVTLILLAFLKLSVVSVTDKCTARNSVDFRIFQENCASVPLRALETTSTGLRLTFAGLL